MLNEAKIASVGERDFRAASGFAASSAGAGAKSALSARALTTPNSRLRRWPLENIARSRLLLSLRSARILEQKRDCSQSRGYHFERNFIDYGCSVCVGKPAEAWTESPLGTGTEVCSLAATPANGGFVRDQTHLVFSIYNSTVQLRAFAIPRCRERFVFNSIHSSAYR